MTIQQDLRLTQPEADYLAFVQRAFEYLAIKKKGADGWSLANINHEIELKPERKDKWATRGVPYNTQTELILLVRGHIEDAPDKTIEQYLATRQGPKAADLASVIEVERSDFPIHSS